MDPEDQKRILEAVKSVDVQGLCVVLGAPRLDSLRLLADTVTGGDPTYAGPLAGVQLGLEICHIVEPEIKAQVNPAVYATEVGVMEDVLDRDAIQGCLAWYRAGAPEGRADGGGRRG